MVAIAGEYRKGKSYLMNHLIEQAGGFKLGHNRHGCTKGMWIWNKVKKVKRPTGDTISVVFIDTEGLLDTDNPEDHDIRILMMTLLLSSHTILNCSQNFNRVLLA